MNNKSGGLKLDKDTLMKGCAANVIAAGTGT